MNAAHELGPTRRLDEEHDLLTVENVDGADFRSYFAQVKIGVIETHSPIIVQDSANEDVPRPKATVEHVAPSTISNENSQLGANYSVTENSENRNIALDLADTAEQDDVDEEMDPAVGGFVMYLSDKASYEIQQDNANAARPYIDRLREIKGTRKVIAELRHQTYSRIVARQIERLREGDVASVHKTLREILIPGGQVLAPYKDEVTDAVTDFYLDQAEEKLSKSEYEEAVEIIYHVRMRATEDNRSEKYVNAAADFMKRVGTGMVDDALNRIGKGDFVAARHIFYALYRTEGLSEYICPVGQALAGEYLKIALEYLVADQLDDGWRTLRTAHLVLDLLSPGSPKSRQFPKSQDFIDYLGQEPDSQFLERTYDVHDGLSPELIDIRFAHLDQFMSILEREIMNDLTQEDWEKAFERLLSLRLLQKVPPRIQPTNGHQMLAKWAAIELFTNTRIRNWEVIIGKDMLLGQVTAQTDHMLPEYRFLYYLSCAEIWYFYFRDMDTTLKYCQQAIRLDTVPSFLKNGSDALYLQARVFARKGLPLDADYCYSLLSKRPNNPWSIYGSPGAVLRQSGIDIVRGLLIGINRQKLSVIMSLMSRGEHNSGEVVSLDPRMVAKQNYYHKNPRSVKLVNALFADDVKWITEFHDIPMNIEPSIFPDHEAFTGSFLHFVSFFTPSTYLRICLRNPWLSVNLKSIGGKTPLHLAAKVFAADNVKMLLEVGANFEAVDNYGNTPLHDMLSISPDDYLQELPVQEALQLLLDLKAQDANGQVRRTLEARNTTLQTPLHKLGLSLMEQLKQHPQGTERKHLKKYRDIYVTIVNHPSYRPDDCDAEDTNGNWAIDAFSFAKLFHRLGEEPPRTTLIWGPEIAEPAAPSEAISKDNGKKAKQSKPLSPRSDSSAGKKKTKWPKRFSIFGVR
ncbi:hypothetical protein TWF696_007601 [Orbilia brochopaga]|uniref:Uncharacterized protein n=1 Tax=Orbilia brochopaga TaxID=3140254 RepID=A0AAV9UM78_9PEZI